MRTTWLVIGWLLALGIASGIYLRWSEVSTPLLLGLVGVIGLIMVIPLLGLGISAWRSRSPSLRVAAVMVLVVYLATFGNIRSVIGCGGGTSDDDIVVFHQNVYLGQADPALVASAILDSGADVAVIAEVRYDFMVTFEKQPGLDVLPYRASEPADASNGLALWSRWPLRDATVEMSGRRPFLHAVVESPHGDLVMYAVHTSAPVEPLEIADWESQLSYLGGVDRSMPTVMAGDFNATADHSQFRTLLAQGWSDVHQTKGCGLDLTWPSNRGTGISLLRLDHVLVTDHFDVLGVEVGSANGSDHRPVVTTIRLTKPMLGSSRTAAPSAGDGQQQDPSSEAGPAETSESSG